MGLFRRDPAAKLKKVFKDYELPTFRGAVNAVLSAIRDPDSSAADVAKVMAADPGLSVKILRLANSSTFSPVKRVNNLAQAIALVGMGQVELLVLNIGVRRTMPTKSVPGYDPRSFWKLAALRATLAHHIAHEIAPGRECPSFTAAYLQDMAVPLLLEHRGKDYGPLWETHRSEGEELVAMERRRFRWDHAEVARWMCEAWNMPEAITTDVGAHHGGGDVSPMVLIASMVTSCDLEDHRDTLRSAAGELCGMPQEAIDRVMERAAQEYEELARLMG